MIEVSEIKYHKTVHDLPLSKFIDCIVENNLSALIISGLPTEQQLHESWENIMNEYTEIIGTQEYRMYVQIFKEISLLKITLQQINAIAHKGTENLDIDDKDYFATGILRLTYDEYFAKELNILLRTDCKFNWLDQKSYHAELDKCISRSKSIKIKIDLKNIQFEAIEEKNKNKSAAKIDRQYFTSILITLSDHAKFRIDENIKMSEYCERVKRFSDYCESMKSKR